MAMGGGGGAAAPAAGLTPLQMEQAKEGNALYKQFFQQGAPVARALMADASGGLLTRGMKAVDAGLQGPSVLPGMAARTASRYGVSLSPEEQAANQATGALAKAGNTAVVRNAARTGIVAAQRDMRFGGE